MNTNGDNVVYIGATEAGKILGFSRRWMTILFKSGTFRSAFQPGICKRKEGLRGPQWKVSRQEVVWHKAQSHFQNQE